MTQSAISKQIASLEDYIGARLFERSPTGVSLTLEGRELHQSLSPAFETLHESFERFSRKPPRSRTFRVATTASFAANFLMPRLAAFETDLPGVELEILTADRIVDLKREEIDLSIRYGAGGWDGLISSPFGESELTPVCAPHLFEQAHQNVETLVTTNRRIQTFLKNEWRDWEKAASIPLPETGRTFIMEHFLVAAQSVLAGYGVALLPSILVRDHIESGEMVRFSAPITWDQAFYVTHLPNAEQRPIMRDVLAWLQRRL